MTHPRFLDGDISDGKKPNQWYTEIFRKLGLNVGPVRGYIRKDAPDDIYAMAAIMGVEDFVVPGNKPDRIRHAKNILKGYDVTDASFYSPGLVDQGGNVKEGAEAAGALWHAIAGRAVKDADNIQAAMEELTSQL
jgi:orotidine-5'-phosphate decarboxylase